MSRKSILVRSIETLCAVAVKRANVSGWVSIHVEDVLATILPGSAVRPEGRADQTLPRSALWLHQCAPMSFFPISICAMRGEEPQVSLAGLPVDPEAPMRETIADLVEILMTLDQVTTNLDRALGDAGANWIGSNAGFWLALHGRKAPVAGIHALHGRSAVDIVCKLGIALGTDPRDGIRDMCTHLSHEIPAMGLELRTIEAWSPYNIAAALTHVARHEKILDALLCDDGLRAQREIPEQGPDGVMEAEADASNSDGVS